MLMKPQAMLFCIPEISNFIINRSPAVVIKCLLGEISNENLIQKFMVRDLLLKLMRYVIFCK
jgi:hypothetical protein